MNNTTSLSLRPILAAAHAKGVLHRDLKPANIMLDEPSHPDPGLCGACRHSRPMKSDRGSTFFLCQCSFEDPNFQKYPRLPVLACPGYRARQA